LTNNTVLNFIGVVSGGGDNSSGNNSASKSTTVVVVGTPDLSVTVSGSSNIVAGTATNYLISVNNIGNAASFGQITNTTILPSGVTYNSFTGSGWSVVATLQGNGTTLITSTYNGITAAGGSANPLTLNVTPSAGLSNGTTVIINSSASGGGETNATNNSGSFSSVVTVVSPANLSVNISGPVTAAPNSTGTYVVNISNSGNNATSGQITSSITLPVGVSYNSFIGNGWTFVSASPQGNGTTILTFTTNNSISAGGNASALSLNLSYSSSLTNNTVLNFTSTVSGGGSSNSTGTTTTVIKGTPDIISNIFGPSVIFAGGTASYTLSTSNIGNAPTSGFTTTTFTVPSGLSYNSFLGNNWSFGSAILQPNGTTLVTFTYTGVIPVNGTSNNLTVNVTAGNLANGTNVTAISVVSGGGDISTANNSNSFNSIIIVQNLPDLTVTITGPSLISVNLPVNYTINVNNINNVATNNPIFVNTVLPVGVSYNSTSGTGWSSVSTLQVNGTTLVVSTNSGIIPANGNSNILILNVTASSSLSAGTIIVINGSVLGGGEGNTANNSFTISSIIHANTTFPDSNTAQINLVISGNVSTNDVILSGTTYGTPIPANSNPSNCVPIMSSNGSYTFTCATAGIYTYNVPVCPPEQTTACPTTPLVITVKASCNLVAPTLSKK
jgi:hypothetical protein